MLTTTDPAPLLSQLSAIAGHISHAELRVLLQIASDLQHGAARSLPAIAAAAKLDQQTVKRAIRALRARSWLEVSTAPPRINTYQLRLPAWAATASTFEPGVNDTPSKSEASFPPGVNDTPSPGVNDTPSSHLPGVSDTPLPGGIDTPLRVVPARHAPEPARARVDRSIDSDRSTENALDAILMAAPAAAEPTTLELARSHLHGYMRAWGPPGAADHPPDDHVCAQFTAIAAWPALAKLLERLKLEGQHAGSRYTWFIAVALQRLRGVAPEVTAARRAQLRKPPAREGDLIAELTQKVKSL